MNHEREQSHARSPEPDAPRNDDVEPGQASRSALLRKPDHAIASGLVQRKARDANGVAEGADEAVATASSSSGSPLPDTLMRKFESSLGADLGGVRVHSGEGSAAANDAVGAKAYTIGQDIHFGAGQYDPSSQEGEHLLAHEVAHTVQQSGGAQRMQFKLAVSSPGDHLEHEADRAAEAMVIGAPASFSSHRPDLSRMIQRDKNPALPTLKIDLNPLEGLPAPPLSEEDKQQIAKLKETFTDFSLEARSLIADISQQQSSGIQELKETLAKAPKVEPKPDLLKMAVETVVGFAIGKLGAYLAAQAVASATSTESGERAKGLIDSAFGGGGEALKKAAGEAVAAKKDTNDALIPFFFGLVHALPAANSEKRLAIAKESHWLWDSSERRLKSAKDAVGAMKAIVESGQSLLKSKKAAGDARKAAMDQWLVFVAKTEMGEHFNKKGEKDGTDMYKPQPGKQGKGVLEINVDLRWKDNTPISPRFSSRSITGIDDEAAKLAYAGLKLKDMPIPKIVRGMEEEQIWTFNMTKEWRWVTKFAVKVNEQGVIWLAENAEASAWLQARGGNKDPSSNYSEKSAWKGAELLLAELSNWVVF
jgi:hypothetical protein